MRDRNEKEDGIQRWAAAENWYIEHTFPSEAVNMVVPGGDGAG